MAKEYIEREAVLKMQYWEGSSYARYGVVDVADIESIPAADVKEVVHGEWRPRGGYFRCSECDTKTLLKDVGGTGGFSHEYEQILTNFCPNCGADMRGRKE